MQLPVIRPMTPADVEPVTAAFIREHWGDRRLNLEFVTRHDETHPFVADADGVVVGTGRREPQRAGRLDRHDLGRAGVAPPRRRPRADEGDDRHRRGGRLPDARARRHRRRPADVRATRVRGPDRLPDPRGARAGPRRRRARRSGGSATSSRPTWPRWRRSTPRRPARTARTCSGRSPPPRRRMRPRRRRRDAGRLRRPGAVGRRRDDRAPDRGRRGDPPRPTRRRRPREAGPRRAADGERGRSRAPGGDSAGPTPGTRPASSGAIPCAGSPTRSGASSTTPSAEVTAADRVSMTQSARWRPPMG